MKNKRYDLNFEAQIAVGKEFENQALFKRISYDYFNHCFTVPTKDIAFNDNVKEPVRTEKVTHESAFTNNSKKVDVASAKIS